MIYLDTETYSATPIKNGTYRYCSDVEVMIITYAFDDGPVNIWDVTDGSAMPGDLAYMLYETDEEIIAHNAMFDRNALRLGHLKIDLPIARWRCTMVQAMAHALPGGLDKLCELFKIDAADAKLKDGRQLILLFCKPRPESSVLRRATSKTHPIEWARFCEYAKSDISAMRALTKKMPQWNYSVTSKSAAAVKELALWHQDQAINDRGVCVDTEFAEAAVLAVAAAQKQLKGRTIDMTEGQVESTSKRDQLILYLLEEYGVELPNLQSDTLERRINDPDLPETLKELLRIRLQVSTTSTSKYKAFLKAVVGDRLCGMLQFNGAGRTRRDAGRTVQLQNLPRPVLDHEEVAFGIEAIKEGVADLCFENVMQLTSSAIRGCIVAPKGKKLVIADLANIEGRVAAWEAGEHWKMQAFRDFDAGKGPDMYKLAYAKSFHISHLEVTKKQRQIGKVQELFLQYQGSVGAFVTGAETYSIDLDELAVAARHTIDLETWAESKGFLRWARGKKIPTYGLPDDVYIACHALTQLWRRAHPEITSLWPDLESAMLTSLSAPGEVILCRKFKIRCEGQWLRIGMPSGRSICYPYPHENNGKISYAGMNQYTKQWGRQKTYGGKILENLTQSLARDVLFDTMPFVEAAGYKIVMRVHDEYICEAPDSDEFNHEHLSSIIATNPSWCPDMPLAAAGFSAYRYRKE